MPIYAYYLIATIPRALTLSNIVVKCRRGDKRSVGKHCNLNGLLS